MMGWPALPIVGYMDIHPDRAHADPRWKGCASFRHGLILARVGVPGNPARFSVSRGCDVAE